MEPVVAEIFDAGIAFIDRSKAALSGMWKTKGKSVYCDFHTCFCATIALLDHTNSKVL